MCYLKIGVAIGLTVSHCDGCWMGKVGGRDRDRWLGDKRPGLLESRLLKSSSEPVSSETVELACLGTAGCGEADL
mgnify:CR=1 FL=1